MDCAESSTCAGQIHDYNSFNPYTPGGTSRTGYNFLYEPLYFFNAYEQDAELMPWIALDHRYNENFTSLEIDIRPGVEWSDGHPWTAEDLVFTIRMLKDSAPELLYSTDMETWVERAVAVDDHTVRIQLKAPNPRFLFNYFVHSGDQGVPIVPAHIWRGQDPTTFANFGPEGPVITGPYRLARSEPAQRIWDLRPQWWAARLGFQPLPQVERLVFLPYMDEALRVQNMIANNLDTCLELRPANILAVLEQNPSITTWTGRRAPHSYLTWWPISLGFNTLEPPFDDPRLRRAINYAIDRDQLVEVAWQGSGAPTLLPLPDVPRMAPYFAALTDELERTALGTRDLTRSAVLMRAAGWQRPPGGAWTRDGQAFSMIIDIIPHFRDLVPVLVAQLEKAGFAAQFRMTSDVVSRMAQGTSQAFMIGNFNSLQDPYFALRHYHSRFVRPTGEAAEQYWRWSHAGFDALIDRMGATHPDDPLFLDLYIQAMEIWLAELPSIPLVQWPHRIPHNQTYWKNWPSADRPYINSAYWSRTFLLVLLGLEPTQT